MRWPAGEQLNEERCLKHLGRKKCEEKSLMVPDVTFKLAGPDETEKKSKAGNLPGFTA